MVGGTAAYMAPELLQAGACASYNSDVYAFGILLNELVSEEQPYGDQARAVFGKGPYGAAQHAAQGGRPTVRVPAKLLDEGGQRQGLATPLVALIQQCWRPEARLRPTFTQCIERISDGTFFVPNSEQLIVYDGQSSLSIAPPVEIYTNSQQISNILFIFLLCYLIWAANILYSTYYQ